jgi:hypothetical protein
MKKKDKEFDKIYKKVHKIMFPQGMNCGNTISKLLKNKNNITIPLYRSALAITPDNNGGVLLETYGDPHFMGKEITNKTIKENKDIVSFYIQGERIGAKVWLCLRGKCYNISDIMFLMELDKIFEEIEKKWEKIVRGKYGKERQTKNHVRHNRFGNQETY